MQTKHIVRWGAPLLLAAALGLNATAGAANQLAPVTLNATPVVSTVVGRTSLGAPITVMTVTRTVNYADLNLATRSGAAALVKRVKAAALAACRRLDADSLMERPETLACARKAESDALRQVRLAVAVAEVLQKRA